ncbi:MAG: hypothetical protein VX992_06505, partial [Acidobacteriota bacterium]|nr:hypothetical protein [Acidobacteriota bacterium]
LGHQLPHRATAGRLSPGLSGHRLRTGDGGSMELPSMAGVVVEGHVLGRPVGALGPKPPPAPRSLSKKVLSLLLSLQAGFGCYVPCTNL